ncbi:MAG: hypothetical protein JOY51_09200 [Nevskia sp.]|nr:hypothetical protein [Nevskia sp.]
MSRHAIRRYASIVALAFASLLGLSLVLWLEFPPQTATQQLAHGYSSPVVMPWSFGEISNGNRLNVQLRLHWFSPRRWTIIPDDRLTALKVNGRDVPLDGVRPGGLTDWRHGFDIDLSPWLHRGDNQLEFTVDNYWASGGIVLRPLPGWRTLPMAAWLLPWLLALARLFRLRRSQLLILAASLLVLASYWGATDWTVRNYDVLRYDGSGHLGYVGYVAHKLHLPPPNEGWEYFQPPLYYLAGAALWRWADWLELPPAEALQGLALAFWLVFLVASAAALRIGLRRSTAALGLATAALALWPSGVIHGLRLGNDPPFYAAAAVATWFMLRWWRGGRPHHLYGMALAIAAALLCKTSASALLAAAALLFGLRLLRGRWRSLRAWGQGLVAGAIMLAGVGLSLWRGLWYWWHGQIASWLIGNIGTLDDSLRVPQGFRYFIPLDIPVFLTSPWVDTRDDATGRTNFWNFLLRSALTGEFSFDDRTLRIVSWGWGALLLGLLFLLLARLGKLRWAPAAAWRETPWIALSLLWLASILTVRIQYPFSCEADFRFILPILVPFLIACVRNGAAARLLLTVLAGGSVAFFSAL